MNKRAGRFFEGKPNGSRAVRGVRAMRYDPAGFDVFVSVMAPESSTAKGTAKLSGEACEALGNVLVAMGREAQRRENVFRVQKTS